MEMTDKMKALGNDFITKCENQGLTFEEMRCLLLFLQARSDEAIVKLQKHHMPDTVARIRKF